MTQLVLKWALDWLIGWGGLSLIVAAAAAAVWVIVPRIFTTIRAIAFNVAIGALAFNFAYTMGYRHGANVTRAEWAAAEARQLERGADARAEAEQAIPQLDGAQPDAVPVPVPVPRNGVPRWMRDDIYNRDNR